MQQDLGQVEEHARDLVADRLGGMEVAGIEAQQLLARDAVAQIKLGRPHRAALGADAEQFRLHGVEHMLGRQRRLEHLVERLGEPHAGGEPVGGRVLEAVGHPHVRHARCAQGLAHRGPDFAAPSAVLDPEVPDALVGVREREAVGGLGMREAGGVEIEADPLARGPVDPASEVGGLDRVAIDLLAAKLPVEGVQVHPMPARDQREGLGKVGPQFVGRAGLARVVARHGQAAAEPSAGVLEAAHVVSLPAVERDGDLLERRERRGRVHPERVVLVLGESVRVFNRFLHVSRHRRHGAYFPARLTGLPSRRVRGSSVPPSSGS